MLNSHFTLDSEEITLVSLDLIENVEAAKKAGFTDENLGCMNLNDSVNYLLSLIETGSFSCMAEEIEHELIDDDFVDFFDSLDEDLDEEFNKEEEDFSPEPLTYYDLILFICGRHNFNYKC